MINDLRLLSKLILSKLSHSILIMVSCHVTWEYEDHMSWLFNASPNGLWSQRVIIYNYDYFNMTNTCDLKRNKLTNRTNDGIVSSMIGWYNAIRTTNTYRFSSSAATTKSRHFTNTFEIISMANWNFSASSGWVVSMDFCHLMLLEKSRQ